MGDQHMGLQARLMSQAMRKLTSIISKSRAVVIFINQIREKIGVMFGSPETTPGGRALKFYSSVRIDIRRIETLKKGEDRIGNRVRAKIVKNKIAPPFKEAIFDIIFGLGILREPAIIEAALQQGIVERSGTWYSYSGGKIGQGKEGAVKYLTEHPDIAEEIEKLTKEKFFGKDKKEEDKKDGKKDSKVEDFKDIKAKAAKKKAV